MFLFRNPLFCRGGGENQYIITATDPAGNSATANGTFTGTSPT
ncbi:hypothetical protein SEENIN0B_04592 [Salmonella enterica subsp. enterica serovar Infantis str. SARB27]|nr:hypothetical protein SEENIN0B_04592 [Salmonella enterica subsp. enterica serovar Infantis str. SARB27]